MCSIFHNRINFRGPQNAPEGASAIIGKNFDADRNNNDSCRAMLTLDQESDDEGDRNERNDLSLGDRDAGHGHIGDRRSRDDEVIDGVCDGDDDNEDSNKALDLSILPNRLPNNGHVSLEALENTKVAMAQFAANALANAQRYGDSGINEFDMVQSTILNVQRQHLIQLQLIRHLQNQLKFVASSGADNPATDDGEANHQETDHGNEQAKPKESEAVLEPSIIENLSLRGDTSVGGVDSATTADEKFKTEADIGPENVTPVKAMSSRDGPAESTVSESRVSASASGIGEGGGFQTLMCDISSTLASTIITNHDPPPPLNEPNCLEMLQRRTEEVLDSASQSHSSHLQDEYESAQRDAQGRGEIFKHRCRYCGKIFGSYSALQIHLRSHTGERPFHCNVCGSKFTTKGNLKVHYQRHTQTFPPMLLAPGVGGPERPEHFRLFSPVNPIPVPSAGAGPPPMPVRLPLPGAIPREEFQSSNDGEREHTNKETSRHVNTCSDRLIEANIVTSPEKPEDLSKSRESEVEVIQQPLKTASEETATAKPDDPPKEVYPVRTDSTSSSQNPKRSGNARKRQSLASSTPCEAKKPMMSVEDSNSYEPSPKNFRRSSTSRNSSNSCLDQIPPEFSLMQMERIIDKSWEELIEIDKTSETSKLQQLVDNIENKLTDPNQCIFCQKVMSCRSSLQMHLRTHTGERPFRCKICGRAFATKGNLKAHMSIHKIKPPMRSQFKCPVCHQKFSNGIILQQHIRIHTIDDGTGSAGAERGKSHFGSTSSGMDSVSGLNAEQNARLKAHLDGTIEDQNSNKSIGASDNFDFSTASEYSGRRSESSSQGEMFEDFTTTDSTNDSRENSSSITPSDRRAVAEEKAEAIDPGRHSVESQSAVDLSSRSFAPGATTTSQPPLDGLPVLGMPPNLFLMANAHEEMHSIGARAKFPLLPFGPLGFIGIHPQAPPICNLCFAIFPNPNALEDHIQREHTKDARIVERSNCDKNFLPTEGGSVARDGAVKATANANANANANSFGHERHVAEEQREENDETLSGDGRLKNRIKQEPISEQEQPPQMSVDSERGSEGAYDEDQATGQFHDSPEQPIDAEQSLMKMQLLSSLPHEGRPVLQNSDGYRLPPSPLNFQQALLSVGPANPNAESPISNKHFCHVCRRNFSSSSALQIHMRTHTGDKPFQCNICQKAFTTKGNLKVHMGTHMWSNPTSRRGRRMSLELPIHRPGGLPPEPEFPQRRPDFPFLPYLPPFFNGLPPPKPNDLSPSSFHNLPPPPLHFANGTATKYPLGVLAFPQFLGHPCNFPNSLQQHLDEQQGNPAAAAAAAAGHREGSPDSSEYDKSARNGLLDQIKRENNQNETRKSTEDDGDGEEDINA